MKRGFLVSSPKSRSAGQLTVSANSGGVKRNNEVPPPLAPSSSTSPSPTNASTTSTSHSLGRALTKDVPTITVKNDYTAVYSDDPLILHSDYRCDSSYFGYFPPGAKLTGYDMVYIDQDVSRIESAMKWPIWNKAASVSASRNISAARTPSASNPWFEIVQMEGKGVGMRATRDIAAGELIHSERPFYISLQTNSIAKDQDPRRGNGDFHRNAASRLAPQHRKALLELSNCYSREEMDDIPGRLATNYLPVDVTERPADPRKNEVPYCGAFPVLSKANHSCGPNANYFFQFSDFTGRFYATRDIKRGDEITIMYTDILKSQAERRDSLLSSHHFVCTCSWCSLPAEQLKVSDANRLGVETIINLLGIEPLLALPLVKLRSAQQLAEKEHLHAYKVQLYDWGARSLMLQGKDEKGIAKQWFKRAKEGYTRLEGEDSYHVKDMEAFLQRSI